MQPLNNVSLHVQLPSVHDALVCNYGPSSVSELAHPELRQGSRLAHISARVLDALRSGILGRIGTPVCVSSLQEPSRLAAGGDRGEPLGQGLTAFPEACLLIQA